MSIMTKAIFSWSGGKDSAYCLNKVLTENQYDVKYLLTTLNHEFKRISMHGVREELLDAQAEAIGIPLLKVWVQEGTNEEYERQMEKILLQAKSDGIKHVIFGDIFLEDLRKYREQNLAKVGMKGIFPLWQMNTTYLIKDFIAQQFKTITCCISNKYLDETWVGKEVDNHFLEQLPSNVDPCGENGEYHTFCYEAPIFKNKIRFTIGEKVFRPIILNSTNEDGKEETSNLGFWFCDIVPA